MHVYLSHLSRSVNLYGKNVCLGVFSSHRGKAGSQFAQLEFPAQVVKFLSCNHSVSLCRDDIMKTLQSVPGEIIPGKKILM